MNARTIASNLVSKGAVLFIPEFDVNVLVGFWEWIDDRRVFYFEANAENAFGAHLLEFDRWDSPHALAVVFYKPSGEMVACLSPIEEAAVDKEYYRRGWDHWAATEKDSADFIQQMKQQLLP